MTESRTPDWRRVDELFAEALELPEAERVEHVRRASGGDDALRAAVEALLEVESRTSDFLEDGGLRVPSAVASELWSDASPGSPDPGDPIGRYRVVRELGRGGTSTVYLAERADGTFEQQVALKLLRADGDAELAARLRHEQQILATLSHPNLAKVFDGGVTEDGRPYLVVERIEGAPITRHCDEARLSIRERLELFAQVARAVQYAHQNLVVHRDLKPSNILVTGDGHVKLLDFGIAKLLEPDGSPTDRTVGVTRWMTPRYAAPEQILGRPVTTATDVHALGVILYELLSGTRPFGEGTSTRYEIERAICETEPSAPSAAVRTLARRERAGRVAEGRATDPERLERTLGGDLDAIVLKALRKDPEERYPSADAMREDVERYLAGFPVEARGGTLGYRTRKFVQRHRLAVAAAAAFVLLLGGGLAALTVQQAATARERDRAEQETANAQATVDFLADVFRGRNPGEAPGDTVSALELVEWAEERLPTEFADRPEVRAELLTVLGDAYGNLGYLERGRKLLIEAAELRGELHGERSLERAATLARLETNLSTERDFDSAAVVAREVLGIRRETLATDAPEVASALAALGQALRDRGRPDSAEVLLREAVAIRERRRGEDEGAYVSTLLQLAYVLRAAGQLDEAERLYREGIPAFREHYGEGAEELPAHLNNFGYLLRVRGDYEGAVEAYRDALERLAAMLGRGHPNTVVVAGNLSSSLELLGEVEEADSVLSASVAATRAHWQGDHWRVGSSLGTLGRSRLRAGRIAEAEGPLREAAAIYARVLGPDHNWTVAQEATLGIQRLLSGRPAEGSRMLEGATAMVERWRRSEEGIGFGGLQLVEPLVRLLDQVGLYEERDALLGHLPESCRLEPDAGLVC